jgi:hypothetical protein
VLSSLDVLFFRSNVSVLLYALLHGARKIPLCSRILLYFAEAP